LDPVDPELQDRARRHQAEVGPHVSQERFELLLGLPVGGHGDGRPQVQRHRADVHPIFGVVLLPDPEVVEAQVSSRYPALRSDHHPGQTGAHQENDPEKVALCEEGAGDAGEVGEVQALHTEQGNRDEEPIRAFRDAIA